MSGRTLRGQVAVAGVGETAYYKHGRAPVAEFRLALDAILAACRDAGIDPHDIDGFASYSNDRCDPSRLAAALGLKRLRSTTMQWGGGGGGCAAAVGNAAAAIAAGLADCVVVFRALAQGRHGRFGQALPAATAGAEMAYMAPYGVLSPAQKYAMKVRRYMHEHGVRQEALRAVALASYRHAQANPRAVMHGKPLDEATYDASRWIVEPFHLYDVCMENDGAAAIVLVSAERARDLKQPIVAVLGVGVGNAKSGVYWSQQGDFTATPQQFAAPRSFAMAGVGPDDVDVLACYDPFTIVSLMQIEDMGFCAKGAGGTFVGGDTLHFDSGKLPYNTHGGMLSHAYVLGIAHVTEIVRQLRGEAAAQVKDAQVGVYGGYTGPQASTLVLGRR